jgi:hypothetical protein
MRSEEETTRDEKRRPKASTSRHAMHLLESAQAACRRSSFFFSEWAGVRNFFDGRALSIYVPHLRHALLFKRWVVIAHG